MLDCSPYKGAIVDCSANQLDLRPAVDEIMSAVNWILDRIPEDVPLVILAGEDHWRSIHVVLQQVVLAECLKSKIPVALGFELAHDYADRLVESGKIISFDAFNFSKEVKNYAAYQSYPTKLAPLAHKALLSFCLRNGISTSFNDLSVKGSGSSWKINLEDDFTRAMFAEAFGSELNEDVSPTKSNGINLRNRAIVSNAMSHIKRARSRLYVQATGSAHVFGYEDFGWPYDESLCKKFFEEGCAVLPVLPESSAEFSGFSFPPDASEALQQSIIIKGLRADYFEEPTIAEDRFVKKVCIESGLQNEAFV